MERPDLVPKLKRIKQLEPDQRKAGMKRAKHAKLAVHQLGFNLNVYKYVYTFSSMPHQFFLASAQQPPHSEARNWAGVAKRGAERTNTMHPIKIRVEEQKFVELAMPRIAISLRIRRALTLSGACLCLASGSHVTKPEPHIRMPVGTHHTQQYGDCSG